MGEDLVVERGGRVDDLQAAVHEAEGPDGRVCAGCLGGVGVGVLACEGAVLGDPVFGVVWFVEGVADAGVAGGEDALGGGRRCVVAGLVDLGVVEGEVHELVHVAEDEHVGVELDDAGVLSQREGHELAPAVVEARVVGVVLSVGGEDVVDALGGDAAEFEGVVAGLGEGVCVEGDEGVF